MVSMQLPFDLKGTRPAAPRHEFGIFSAGKPAVVVRDEQIGQLPQSHFLKQRLRLEQPGKMERGYVMQGISSLMGRPPLPCPSVAT